MADQPTTGPTRTQWFQAAIAATGLGVLTGLASSWPRPWQGWAPASCLPDRCFCEAARLGLVRQPANAISSLAFLVPGLAISANAWQDRSRSVTSGLGLAGLFGAALIVIGLGSGFFHASLSFAGQTLDVLGMYLLGTLAVLAGWHRLQPLGRRTLAGTYLAANGLLLWSIVFAPATRRWLFAGLVAAAVSLELAARYRPTVPRRWLWRALGCLALGFGIWVLDLRGLVCSPTSLWQGHAAWHGLTAASAVFLFQHYRAAEPGNGR